MLATSLAGPEPRKAPLQRPRLAGAFEAMPLACLDGSVPLPKHRAIPILPAQAVAPAASEEGSGGHLSLTARARAGTPGQGEAAIPAVRTVWCCLCVRVTVGCLAQQGAVSGSLSMR
jgi:hypothetical protein